MTPHDEPPRDAWLSQALRHAPDADLVPPRALSDAILQQAYRAVKPVRTNPLLQLWAWLARPPVAAGFATLTVATLVGVMWWDRPMDEARPRPAAPEVSAERTAPPPSSAATRAAPTRDEPAAAAPPATASKRERTTPDRTAARADKPRAREADGAPAAGGGAAPAAAPTPAPPPVADQAVRPATPPARDETAERRSAPALAKAAAPTESAAGQLSARRQSGTDATTPALSIDQPEHWTWQRATGLQPMTPALQRWLAQLDRSAHWRPSAGAPPAAAADSVLQLWRDGVPQATITLFDDAAWLVPAAGAPLMAPLSPAEAASLKAALVTATR